MPAVFSSMALSSASAAALTLFISSSSAATWALWLVKKSLSGFLAILTIKKARTRKLMIFQPQSQ